MGTPAASTRFFRVRNLDKYQHYRDRNPPWIKLHQSVTEDTAFALLPDAAKGHLVLIWLLASRMDNRLPLDPVFIGARINARDPVDLNLLVESGFLELVPLAARKRAASKPLAPRTLPHRDIEQRENGEQRTPPPPADAGAETGPAYGVLLEEARCPACRYSGGLRAASRGRGFFCGTQLGGCGQTYDLGEPSILGQLTPRARTAIENRLGSQPGPQPVPPAKERDPAEVELIESAWRDKAVLVKDFLRWYTENPEAGDENGRSGMHGIAFGRWPKVGEIPREVRAAVLTAALAAIKERRAG